MTEGGPYANNVPIDRNRPSPNPGPGMDPVAYRKLVEQNGKSRITAQDVEDLQRKVRKLRVR